MLNKQILILIFLIITYSCKEKINKEKNKKLAIWEKILEADNENNISFLLQISGDSLQCVECDNGKSWVKKSVFFNKYINQLRLGSKENYSYFVEDLRDVTGYNKRYRISYAKKFRGNKYDIIYTILEGEKGIKFLGVFSVP